MRNTLSKAIAGIGVAIAIASSAFAASFDIPSQAPTTIKSATNLAATVASGATSNQTSRIPVIQGKGLTIQAAFNVSSGTSNVVHDLYPVMDGTNVWTVPLYSIISTAKTATAVTNGIVLRADQLYGMRALQIAITNQNAGTLTNFGVKWGYSNQ